MPEILRRALTALRARSGCIFPTCSTPIRPKGKSRSTAPFRNTPNTISTWCCCGSPAIIDQKKNRNASWDSLGVPQHGGRCATLVATKEHAGCFGLPPRRGSRARWRYCRSPDLRPHSSGSTLFSSSMYNAPPALVGFSARLPPRSRISSYATYPEWAAIGVGAAPAEFPPSAAALPFLPDIAGRSAIKLALYAADPTPTLYFMKVSSGMRLAPDLDQPAHRILEEGVISPVIDSRSSSIGLLELQ